MTAVGDVSPIALCVPRIVCGYQARGLSKQPQARCDPAYGTGLKCGELESARGAGGGSAS